MGAHDADRLAGLHEHRLVGLERAQRAHERVERLPVAGGAAGAAVDDEVVGALGDLGVEVVHAACAARPPAASPARSARCRAARGRGGLLTSWPWLLLASAVYSQLADRGLDGAETTAPSATSSCAASISGDS